MRYGGLERGENRQNRTLYSLIHAYATLELIEKKNRYTHAIKANRQ